jgi:hypothetical protein
MLSKLIVTITVFLTIAERCCVPIYALQPLVVVDRRPLQTPSRNTYHSSYQIKDRNNDDHTLNRLMNRSSESDCVNDASTTTGQNSHRRRVLTLTTSFLTNGWLMIQQRQNFAFAAGELPDKFNVDDYLKSGMVMNPMGVAGQAGKSKPVTGM